MAQELIDKIRAQAQARGIDPDVAVRIAQAESSLNPNAQAKTSSAQGLFQVVDRTWKEHGGRPGMKKDTDENIRVGLNVIERNTRQLRTVLGRDPSATEVYAAHFLGPTGAKTVLAADPNTPVERVLSARAVKANPSMLKDKNVGELLAQLEGKMGGLRPTARSAPAPAKRTPAEEIMEPALKSGMTAKAAPAAPSKEAVAALGPGYQAALALSFLSKDDEDEDATMTREEWADKQGESEAAKMLAEYKPKNALADINWDESSLLAKAAPAPAATEEPQMLAEGGEVNPVEDIQAAARRDPSYQSIEKYLQTRDAVPTIKMGSLPEGTGGVFNGDKLALFNGTIRLNEDIPTAPHKKGIGPSVLAHEMAHAADQQMRKQFLEQRLKGNQFTEAYEKLVGPEGSARTQLARMLNPEWASENRTYRASPQELAGHGVGAFAGPNTQDRAPRHVDASAAQDFQVLLELAQRHAGQGPTGLAKIPAFFSRLKGYADGGEVEPTPEELERASRPAFLTPKSGIGRKISTKPGEIEAAALQGVSEMPYNLFGAPVDLVTLAMRPFGYQNPSPVMGSDWIKGQMTRLGVRPEPPTQPTQRAAYELAQLGSSAINPAAPVRGAVAAGKAGTRAAREMLSDFQTYNQQLSAPGASYAVKPKGGVFAYTYQGDSRQKLSKLDNLISEYVEEAKNVAPDDSKLELMQFLRAKAPKYFTTTYGTAEDPLRTAIRERRFEPSGREASRLPPYLVDAAANPQARGHAQAAVDLERAYDELTGMRSMVYAAPDAPRISEYDRRMQLNAALGREGVPLEARNPPSVDVYSQEDFIQYPHGSRFMRGMVEQGEALPPHLQHALRTGETIYDVEPRFSMLDPENVIESLQALPTDKLKNMSFPEALIQGMQASAPIRDYKTAIELAEKGAAVPPAALMKFTQPVTPTVGGQWVKITEPIATKMEGKLMKHSVGGYAEGDSYGTTYTGLPYGGKKAFDEGLVEVYSLRDQRGQPAITVEVANKGTKEEPKWSVTQVRGRFNSEPKQSERGAVFDLFDKLSERGRLVDIKSNSYSKSANGESLEEGSRVDWGHEYDLWKTNFEE